MRIGIGALLLLCWSALGAHADDEPHRLSLSYDVHLSGIPLLSFEARAMVAPDRYTLRTYLFTYGVLDWLFRFRNESAADGTVAGGMLSPTRYTTIGQWRGSARSADLRYRDGEIEVAVEPDPASDDRDPVPDALRRNTIDPLSAIVLVNLGNRPDGPCPATAPVFDGRRRYDMRLELVGAEVIEAGSAGTAAGPAIKCLLSVEQIAGYPKSRPRQTRPPSEIWFQRLLDDSLWIPVRISGESFFGGFTAELRAYEPRRAL
jgi:hypothetical protein